MNTRLLLKDLKHTNRLTHSPTDQNFGKARFASKTPSGVGFVRKKQYENSNLKLSLPQRRTN